MKMFRHFGSGAVFAAAILFGAGTSKAAVTACGSTTNHSLNLGGTGSGLNGTAAANNAPAQGCGQNDLGFSSFAINQETGTGNTNGPSGANIDPTTTGSGFNAGNTTVGNIGLTLTAAYSTGNAAFLTPHTVDETIGFVVTPNSGGSAEEPPSPNQWALEGVTTLGIAGQTITTAGGGIPTGNNNPSISISELVCIGQKSTSTCAAGNEATLTLTVTYSGNGTTTTLGTAVTGASCTAGAISTFGCAIVGTNGTGGITFNPTLSAAVIDTVLITAPADTTIGDTYDMSFASFSDPFSQGEIGPEPSTFLLLGSALAGLGVIGYRKRKRA